MADPDTPRAAAPRSRRTLAPDLARGVMLLLIALAHTPAYLHDRLPDGGEPNTGTALVDRVVSGIETVMVTGRAYPLFALLLGYGLVRFTERQRATGRTPLEVRRLLRRRGAALIGLGFAHAALLWGGDILGAYGVLTVLLAGLVVRVPDRWLLVASVCSLAVVAVGGASGLSGPLASTGAPDPITAIGLRLGEWAPTLLLQPLGVVGAVLVGVWAARHRVLEDVVRHRALPRGTAVLGLTVAVLGGLPLALINAEVWFPPASGQALAGALHSVGGYGGIGFAALIALASVRLAERGRLVVALAACGQRSLSCYLAQSVVFVPVLASYAGGLGTSIGVAVSAVVATVTWALTVATADLMRRRGHPGPAEKVLRRLTYGRSAPSSDSISRPAASGSR